MGNLRQPKYFSYWEWCSVVKMQDKGVFIVVLLMISFYIGLVASVPSSSSKSGRGSRSTSTSSATVSHGVEDQLQGTIGATLPVGTTEGGKHEHKKFQTSYIYSMSTPPYENLESQLQSPQLTSSAYQAYGN